MITDERLREIAETVFEDPDDMNKAINELAAGMLEMRKVQQVAAPKPVTPPADPNTPRMKGRALAPGQRVTQCNKCYSDVVTFKSRRTGKDYLCDAEMGYVGNVRQMVTAPTWFHNCAGGR